MINQVSSSFSNLKSLKQPMKKYFIFHKIHIFHKIYFITGQQKPLLSDMDESPAGTEREEVAHYVTLTLGPASRPQTSPEWVVFSLKPDTWGIEEPPWRNTTSTVSLSHLLKFFIVIRWIMLSWTRPFVFTTHHHLWWHASFNCSPWHSERRGGRGRGREA